MPATKCDHCAGPPIVWQRYAGAHLCTRHFRASVERRVHRELNQHTILDRGARLLVAYSAGKDSTVALQFMADLRAQRPDLELHALTVDEGIEGYRPPALAVAAETCRALDIPHTIRRTRDAAGVTMDEAHALEPDLGACSACGVFRRRLLNDFARELEADLLVTGHNLDDMAQSVLMNLATANLDKLAKLAPHQTAKPGMVRRILPLRMIPESEVFLYAHVRGLRWHDEECPYAAGAARQVYRETLYRLEEARPGTRHSLLRTHDTLKPLLVESRDATPLGECLGCGEPTSGTLCKPCELRATFLAYARSS